MTFNVLSGRNKSECDKKSKLSQSATTLAQDIKEIVKSCHVSHPNEILSLTDAVVDPLRFLDNTNLLTQLGSLRQIDFSGTSFAANTDNDPTTISNKLSNLRLLPNLRTLKLSNCSLIDCSFLSNLTQIHYVDLSRNHIRCLKKLSEQLLITKQSYGRTQLRLETLDLSFNPLEQPDDLDIGKLSPFLPYLIEFDLRGCPMLRNYNTAEIERLCTKSFPQLELWLGRPLKSSETDLLTSSNFPAASSTSLDKPAKSDLSKPTYDEYQPAEFFSFAPMCEGSSKSMEKSIEKTHSTEQTSLTSEPERATGNKLISLSEPVASQSVMTKKEPPQKKLESKDMWAPPPTFGNDSGVTMDAGNEASDLTPLNTQESSLYKADPTVGQNVVNEIEQEKLDEKNIVEPALAQKRVFRLESSSIALQLGDQCGRKDPPTRRSTSPGGIPDSTTFTISSGSGHHLLDPARAEERRSMLSKWKADALTESISSSKSTTVNTVVPRRKPDSSESVVGDVHERLDSTCERRLNLPSLPRNDSNAKLRVTDRSTHTSQMVHAYQKVESQLNSSGLPMLDTPATPDVCESPISYPTMGVPESQMSSLVEDRRWATSSILSRGSPFRQKSFSNSVGDNTALYEERPSHWLGSKKKPYDNRKEYSNNFYRFRENQSMNSSSTSTTRDSETRGLELTSSPNADDTPGTLKNFKLPSALTSTTISRPQRRELPERRKLVSSTATYASDYSHQQQRIDSLPVSIMGIQYNTHTGTIQPAARQSSRPKSLILLPTWPNTQPNQHQYPQHQYATSEDLTSYSFLTSPPTQMQDELTSCWENLASGLSWALETRHNLEIECESNFETYQVVKDQLVNLLIKFRKMSSAYKACMRQLTANVALIDGSVFSKYALALSQRTDLLTKILLDRIQAEHPSKENWTDLDSNRLNTPHGVTVLTEQFLGAFPETFILFLSSLIFAEFSDVEQDDLSCLSRQLEFQVLQILPAELHETHKHSLRTLAALETETSSIVDGETLSNEPTKLNQTESQNQDLCSTESLRDITVRLKESHRPAIRRLVQVHEEFVEARLSFTDTNTLLREFNNKTIDISQRMTNLLNKYPHFVPP